MTMLADETRPIAPGQELARSRQRRRALHALRSVLDVPLLTPDVVEVCRPRAASLAARVTARVQREVAAFGPGSQPAAGRGVASAVSAATELFVDALAGVATSSPAEVFGLYRRIGHAHAALGQDLDAVRAAHLIATQEAWRDVRSLGPDHAVPADVVARVSDALFAFQDQLLEQTVLGFTLASRDDRRPSARGRLLVALLSGAGDGEVAAVARECGWVVPERVAVAVVHVGGVDLRLTLSQHPMVLSGVRHGVLTLVGAPDLVAAAVAALADGAARPAALSWPVEPADTPHAGRWAQRSLGLLRDGLVEADERGVAHCADHRRLLWIEADPVLRRHATQELLAPLAVERPSHRAALARTFLLWLRTRETAPVLAETLDVHVQTVRTRLRHLRATFAHVLADPARTGELLAALEAAEPRWRLQDDAP